MFADSEFTPLSAQCEEIIQRSRKNDHIVRFFLKRKWYPENDEAQRDLKTQQNNSFLI